ncbi:winged helix-turn-helix domain-containing protein [Thalassomonas actiniarum]|uniref:Winged helix-turn-helix domain-containing protein n=1 Tax=Thalassomonas actiniarum TaxID=485447 RepID=A0AAF0C1Y3_9GAMM|nr:winged helix-turn-helix domain-containing protein [Thalassomonas actiniarum]WDD97240.1 winged helix-turn-helix domain-containing protein [Thalassomonas actiniarum]
MRYFHFQDHSLDTQAMVIYRHQQKIELEPKVFELLAFFCQHPDRVISKDELMDNVWSGTLVSDNAISRTIAKVRKALNDDSKKPLYIITVARKGYRFAASVTPSDTLFATAEQPLETQVTAQEAQTEKSPGQEPQISPPAATHSAAAKGKNKKTLALAFALLALLAAIIALTAMKFWPGSEEGIKPARLKSMVAITRDKGTEWHPNISQDQTQLAHTERSTDGQRNQVVLTDLNSQERRYIKHDRGNISRPVWSPNGESLAVLWKHNHVCQILLVQQDEIDDLKKSRTLRECFASAWPVFQFSPDGRFLYFNDKPQELQGYQIFRLDLTTGEQITLNQPITGGEGNYHFDLSGDGNKLVMLNLEYTPQSRIYTLDLTSQQLKRTAELDYRLRSAVWHHDGQSLVHPSPHPATALWHSRLDGEFLGVVASGSQRLKNLRRHPNQSDYLFSAYMTDYDLTLTSIKQADSLEPTSSLEQKISSETASGTWQPDNSSVRDYLPALSHNDQQLAFVSKRSGSAEVWLQNKKTPTAAQLSQFNNATRIFDLLWSPDDKKLLVLADNLLYLIDINSREIKELTTSQTFNNRAIAALSWQNNNRLLFSSQRNNSWQLMSYDINQDKVEVLNYRWQAGRYSQGSDSYYLFDKTNKRWYQAQTPDSEEIALIPATCNAAILGRVLNLKEQSHALYCLSDSTDKQQAQTGIYRYHKASKTFELWQTTDKNISYDIQGNNLISANLVRQGADIMQTRSPGS